MTSTTPRVAGSTSTGVSSTTVYWYCVPREYGVTQYQYTVVDDTPVLVDPATRRIVEVVP